MLNSPPHLGGFRLYGFSSCGWREPGLASIYMAQDKVDDRRGIIHPVRVMADAWLVNHLDFSA